MIKKLLLVFATMIATMGFAFAQVDVNKADKATLDGVKGIGPKMSKTIVDERKKNGEFKDWADFEKRVKGVGDKSSAKLSEAGLTVNGQVRAAAASGKAAKAAASDTKSATAAKDVKPVETQVSATPAKPAAPAMPATAAKPATPATAATPASPASPAAPVKK